MNKSTNPPAGEQTGPRDAGNRDDHSQDERLHPTPRAQGGDDEEE